MTTLYIDFETRSPVDLKTAGLYNYATDPRTEVLCLGYAFSDAGVCLWAAHGNNTIQLSSVHDFIRKGGTVVAHNAAFELAIWNHICVPRYGWPELKPEQVHDTMAMAYAMALPGSLENASAAVGLAVEKDMAGHRLMLSMCKPKEDGTYKEDPESLHRLYEYCKKDVEVERQLYQRLLKLPQAEHALWVLDQAINQRGLYVDIPAIKAAIQIVEKEQARLNNEMRKATGGAVATCTATGQLADWIRSQGVPIEGVAKADVLDALATDGLPGSVRKALTLRQEAGKSSTSKLKAMLESAASDNRIRGTMQYHGAATGRWAGRRIQIQNYPRPPKWLEDPELQDEILCGIRDGFAPETISMLYGPPMEVLSGCLRAFITAAPDHELMACDYSNIEGRVLAWSAGEQWKLDAFIRYDTFKLDSDGNKIPDGKGDFEREGPDLYNVTYGECFDLDPYDVDKGQRQIGKVQDLAFGFGGGVGAGQSMARIYNVFVEDRIMDEWKVRWRNKHPMIVKYWYALEEAAIAAVRNPGHKFTAGAKGREVTYLKSGSFLFCRLPSGRCLCYAYPEIRTIQAPWGDKEGLTYMTMLDSTQRKTKKQYPDPKSDGSWARIGTYGGSLSENNTQAIARDLLGHALPNLEAAGYPTVFHVHDEAVAEIPTGFGSVEEMARVMTQLPPWASGLPVAAAGWRSGRYRKD